MGSVARVRGRQGSILTGWDPLGTGWLPQPQPQSWALPPSHLPAQCPHFPASPSDIGVLIRGAMSLLPLQPLIPTGARAPGEGSSSATASLLRVSRHIPWEAPNLGVPYCQDSSHHTLYQPETRPFRGMTVTDEAPTFIEPRTPLWSVASEVAVPALPYTTCVTHSVSAPASAAVPRGTNAHRADCRRCECQVVPHKLVQHHVLVRGCPRAGLGWVTAHNHAVMWMLLTHVVDEDTEWREGVPCHFARRGRAGDHVALSGAAACVGPLPPPISSSEDSWLLSSWREGLRVKVPGWGNALEASSPHGTLLRVTGASKQRPSSWSRASAGRDRYQELSRCVRNAGAALQSG